MTKPLLLDAFSCAGLGADGYSSRFEVVCLDNDRRALAHNPHAVICGDALTFLSDRRFVSQFDAIHASPPCQGFSATRALANAQGRGRGRAVDLLTPVLELLARVDKPWIVENVPRSPVPKMAGAVQLCGSAFGLQVQRHRWFAPSRGLNLVGSDCRHSTFELCPKSGKPRPWGVYYKTRDNIPSGGRTVVSVDHGLEAMGVTRRVPWKYLCEGLPPAYTRHLANQLARVV